jgi:hypothetical protein
MLFRIQKPNRLRKLLLTDFTEKCKNKKIDEFLVKNQFLKFAGTKLKTEPLFWFIGWFFRFINWFLADFLFKI